MGGGTRRRKRLKRQALIAESEARERERIILDIEWNKRFYDRMTSPRVYEGRFVMVYADRKGNGIICSYETREIMDKYQRKLEMEDEYAARTAYFPDTGVYLDNESSGMLGMFGITTP